MAKKPKFYLPSGGGLMRYSDEYRSKVELSPQVVVGIIIAAMIFEWLLYIFLK